VKLVLSLDLGGGEARSTVRLLQATPSKPVAVSLIRNFAEAPIVEKAFAPTLLGAFPKNLTEVRELARVKASFPIEVTPAGISIEVSDQASWKAQLPMEVTEDGMVIEVKARAP
jgi:hypothetical protein